MKVTIKKSVLFGEITAPPSKSMAHRLLICASLAEGESIIHNISKSEDILATADCASALGAEIKFEGSLARVIGGTDSKRPDGVVLNCRESGSTLRFFIPIAALSDSETEFQAKEGLIRRPMTVYERLFEEKNLGYSANGSKITVSGSLPFGTYEIDGSVSSQFISGLLFALPLLTGDSIIKLIPPVESRPYIDMTLAAQREFGIRTEWVSETEILIKGNQSYKPRELTVEGDYSNSAFFAAANYLGSDIKIKGLSEESLQGDRIYSELFQKLDEGFAAADISDCPDLAPILFSLAFAKHGAIFEGTRRLKIKESDRAVEMAKELAKLGAEITVEENRVTVNAGKILPPTEPIDSHNDHRIAMSLAILLTKCGGVIENAEAVRKSFPNFYEELTALGAEIVKE